MAPGGFPGDPRMLGQEGGGGYDPGTGCCEGAWGGAGPPGQYRPALGLLGGKRQAPAFAEPRAWRCRGGEYPVQRPHTPRAGHRAQACSLRGPSWGQSL